MGFWGFGGVMIVFDEFCGGTRGKWGAGKGIGIGYGGFGRFRGGWSEIGGFL